MIQDWDRVRTDWLTIRDCIAAPDKVADLEIVADHARHAVGSR
jgi:hypothetical protein